MTPTTSTPAVIYCRVSTREQGDSGLGLEAQEAACRREAERRGWIVSAVFREVLSGDKQHRPVFGEACQAVKDSHGVLLAAKADRISRGSVASVLALHERAHKEGWHVFAIDLPEIDTTSPMGEFILTILAGVNRLERRMIGERTSQALRAKAARGEPVGRPRQMPEDTINRLHALRSAGLSYQGIADALNADNIPGAQGGGWFKQSVAQACKRYGVGR